MRAIELRESAREWAQICQYSAQYTTALTEACVALRRWPRELDDEVWRNTPPGRTLQDRLEYLRNLINSRQP